MPAVSPVAAGTLPCPACTSPLDPAEWNHWHEASCPHCRVALNGALAPAWAQPETPVGTVSERAAEGEAVCFFHPENRAVLTCDRCGRFVCSICDLPVGTRHLCPTCLSSGLGQEKLPEVVPWRFLWSWCAFWMGLLPLVFAIFLWPLLFATGPATVFVALFGWKRPGSLTRGRQHAIAVTGLILGLVQVAAIVGFIGLIVVGIRSGSSR